MPIIHGKSLGQKRPLFGDFSVELPSVGVDGEIMTVRKLIAEIVRDQVEKFHERQAQRLFLRVLTERDIAAGAERGKIEAGASDVPLQNVDPDQAVETACQAFEDGLFFVVIDEQRAMTLDEKFLVKPASQLTFIRLTLLAGG